MCTNFIIKSQDNAVINGRSMEFALPLQSQIVIEPRGQTIQSPAPNKNNGLKWTSKYGYIALNGLGINTVVDGFNEKGLSLGALWQPDSVYPIIDFALLENVVSLELLGSCILGNFATIEEVKEGLSKIQVWGHEITQLGGIPPLHLTIHDASGNSLVVEFLKGTMLVLDNPTGVLTNAPGLEWQLTNLRNYIDLTNKSSAVIKVGDSILKPTGQGSGFFGLPGDWTPPSRFVKAVAIVTFVNTPKTAELGVNLSQHILNTFDIPSGIIKEQENGYEFTQWIVIKDLQNLKLYYRTYENSILKVINLDEQDIKEGNKTKIVNLGSVQE